MPFPPAERSSLKDEARPVFRSRFQIGAGDEIRTRDILLGKEAFYH